MRANVDSAETFLGLDLLRKIRTEPCTPDRHALSIGFGTDWSGLVSAWLTEWERGGPKADKAKAHILGTMETIAAQPNGFVQGSGLYDLDTRKFAVATEPVVSVSHLSAVFGSNELCAELIGLVDMPAFKDAYLDYCRYFNVTKAPATERTSAACCCSRATRGSTSTPLSRPVTRSSRPAPGRGSTRATATRNQPPGRRRR